LVEQRLEELHLLGIKGFGGAPEVAAEQLLQPVLQSVDFAALLLQLLEELLALGAKQLDFLSKLAQFDERMTFRGHALSYAPTRAKFQKFTDVQKI
jgi:hypothetical protein